MNNEQHRADQLTDAELRRLIERSSLGSKGARSLRDRISPLRAAAVRRAGENQTIDPGAADGDHGDPGGWEAWRRRPTGEREAAVAAGSVVRTFELMVVFDPAVDKDAITPSLETFLADVRGAGGSVDKVDFWVRRLDPDIAAHHEGTYIVISVKATQDTVTELDRRLNLDESVVQTYVTHSGS
jgi:small subunit ribosomal protein S6